MVSTIQQIIKSINSYFPPFFIFLLTRLERILLIIGCGRKGGKVAIHNLTRMESIKLRLLRHYLPLLILTVIAFILFRQFWSELPVIPFIVRATGYIGIVLLGYSLLIGPVKVLSRGRYAVSTYYRRDIAIFGGAVSVFHTVAGLFVHLRGQMWKYFLERTAEGYTLKFDNFRLANYTGLIAALLILILLITSNDLSIRKLHHGRWKNIQRMAYIIFPLIVIHALFYRLMSKHLNGFYYFYLPVFAVILIFQLAGMTKRIRQKR